MMTSDTMTETIGIAAEVVAIAARRKTGEEVPKAEMTTRIGMITEIGIGTEIATVTTGGAKKTSLLRGHRPVRPPVVTETATNVASRAIFPATVRTETATKAATSVASRDISPSNARRMVRVRTLMLRSYPKKRPILASLENWQQTPTKSTAFRCSTTNRRRRASPSSGGGCTFLRTTRPRQRRSTSTASPRTSSAASGRSQTCPLTTPPVASSTPCCSIG
mmetsp:Transcript_24629/g.41156  ORF Transcript_24629/g.41156 Transcript_24629/m.41156 type:complete len:221 (-) Transcript_24629:256-918(-)